MRIKALIALITVSTFGLLVLQFYWIQQSQQLSREQFDRTVNEALVSVSHQLETRETSGFIASTKNVDTEKIDTNSLERFSRNRKRSSLGSRQRITQGKVVLGTEVIQINPQIAEEQGLNSVYGLYVTAVVPNSPAYYAGLKKGDIITEIDGHQVNSREEMVAIMDEFKKGDRFNISFERKNPNDKSWDSRCNSFDNFTFDVLEDSVSISFTISAQDCANKQMIGVYQVYFDSTEKYNRLVIQDSTDEEGTYVTAFYGVDTSWFETADLNNLEQLAESSERIEQEYITMKLSGTVNGKDKMDSFFQKMYGDTESGISKLDNQNMAHTEAFVSSIMGKMSQRNTDLKERLAPFDIQSLLENELVIREVDHKPEWGVVNADNKLVYKSNNYGSVTGDATKYHTSLFSHDLHPSRSFLFVHFPHSNRAVLGVTYTQPLISLLLILLIIGCFVYAINSWIKQRKMSELTTDFINNMTHELKTPVSTIKLATEMMMDHNVPREGMDRYLQIVLDENMRLGDQIERVLQIAKIEKSETKLQTEQLDIHEVLHEVMEHALLGIEQKNGELAFEPKSTRPVITADPVHLTNIFYNLLDNAVKYTPQLPKIKVWTEDTEEGVLISVKDNGIGMSKEVQKNIFDKFYRVPTGNLHNVKGFGLGLSYVKLITEAHGGEVSVKSKPNQGSVFQLFFPHQQVIS